MSTYLKQKEELARIQREKDAQLAGEREEKIEKERQKAKAEAEKKKARDEAAKEARRLELLKANESLSKSAAGNAASTEYDMFAEDERPKVPTTNSAIKLVGAAKPTKAEGYTRSTSTPRAGPSKPRANDQTKPANGSSSSAAKNGGSPPPLSRKEKAARAFAQSASKGGKSESIFSIRNLVESKDGPSSPRPKATKSQPSIYSSIGKPGQGRSSKVKDQLKKSFKEEGMRKLCPDRDTRDKRTIDQIHTDIKARKGPVDVSFGVSNGTLGRVKHKFESLPTTARPVKAGPQSPTRKPKSRHRSPSSSSTSSYESDRPHKRSRRHDDEDLDEPSQADISAQIQAMFRRPGAAQRKYEDDFSDESDMEAGLSDVEQEERRTAAIARREDLLAEEEEKARKLAKEKAKRERSKGK